MEVDQEGPSTGWTWADAPKPTPPTPEQARAAGHPEARLSAARPQRTFGADEIAFPDTPNKEHGREDNSLLGLPPEFAALSTLAIGRAIGAAGLTAAGRAYAGAQAASGELTPLIKYHVVNRSLRAAGVPGWLAESAAVMLSGKRAAKAEAPAAEGVLNRSVPMSPGAMTQEEIGQRVFQGNGAPAPVVRGAAKGPVGVRPEPVAIDTPEAVASAAKPMLNAAEAGEYLKLRAMGKTEQQARDAIQASRELLQLPGMLSDAEARAALDARHLRGEVKTPSAQTARSRREP